MKRLNMEWLNWVAVALGLWLMDAPFSFDYASISVALYQDVTLGIVIAVLACWRALTPEGAFLSWMLALAGVCVLAGPFALGYHVTRTATTNDLLVGLAVLVVGVFGGLSGRSRETGHTTLLQH
ncbi:MAG: hypothetical protein PVSMB1_18550 [Gemmatimonadaceae bacterium]